MSVTVPLFTRITLFLILSCLLFSDPPRTLLEPRGDNFVISFALREVQSSPADEPLESGLYTMALLKQFREDFIGFVINDFSLEPYLKLNDLYMYCSYLYIN